MYVRILSYFLNGSGLVALTNVLASADSREAVLIAPSCDCLSSCDATYVDAWASFLSKW